MEILIMSETRGLGSLAVALVLLSPAAYSQTTFATITGVVVDATGAVIPNAKITATNVATNVKTAAVSNQAGNYTIAQLQEGAYEVVAEAAGFKEFVVRDVALVARDERRLDIGMEVGAVGSKVEVTAGATLIETETPRLGDTRTALQIKQLPLNTRGMYAFLALAPGVLAGNSGAVKIAGSDDNQSHWTVDGTTFDDGVGSFLGPIGNYVEWMQEIKIDLANNTAEFGALGQVTIISKSGTNQVHGSAQDYYSTPVFRARNPFALARTTGVNHLYGGSVGGPVWFPRFYNGKNKTFFFTSLESSTGGASSTTFNPTVPLPAWRSGDFSGLGATLIYDPQSSLPFPENKIPASRINSVSQKLQDRFYPLPNFGGSGALVSQNFRENVTRPWDPSTNWTVRGDHHFSERDSIFGRFSFQRGYNRVYEGNLPTIGRRSQVRNNRAASVSSTHIFKPTLIDEFRWGFALNVNAFGGPLNGPQFAQDFGLVGLAPNPPNIPGMLNVNWSGIGLQPLTQIAYNKYGGRSHLEEFQEHLSWFRKRHNLKFGFDLTRVEFDNYAANANLFGNVTFSNRFTSGGFANQGNPYADFLLGIPSSAARAFPPVETDSNRWQYDFFALDDFKVNSKLTLNIGLRYELHMPWRENHNLLSLFDIGSGKIVIPDNAMSQVSPLLPAGYVGVETASAAGLPGTTLMRADKTNFAPRIGLAYRPWGVNTVFRAGWGMFYDISPREPSAGSIPFVINEPAYTNPTVNPDVILPRVFPAISVGGPSTVGFPSALNTAIKIPYSFQYNFTIERQQWNTGFRLSYIGTAARQGEWSYNYNSPQPSTVAFVNKPRPFPNYPGINYLTNGAGHQYNAMALAAQRQMFKGLQFQASWTWARDRYDVGRDDGSIEDPFNRAREIAVGPDTPTHRVSANWIYELPFGKGHHWLSSASRVVNLLAGGWNISSVYSIYSGQFLTPMWTGPDPTGTAFTTNTTPAIVTVRPDQLQNANLPSGQRSVNQWFNPAAFAAPQPGQFGTSAKGVIKGPGVDALHLGVYKEIRFRDAGPLLRWELTATNVLNHPNWSNPVVNITQTSNVAVISAVGGVDGGSTGDMPGPRTLRMGLRVEW
jgi:hypothetical protein